MKSLGVPTGTSLLLKAHIFEKGGVQRLTGQAQGMFQAHEWVHSLEKTVAVTVLWLGCIPKQFTGDYLLNSSSSSKSYSIVSKLRKGTHTSKVRVLSQVIKKQLWTRKNTTSRSLC